jgi:hypothetical protein
MEGRYTAGEEILAIFGHLNKFVSVSENGEHQARIPLACQHEDRTK